jgi:hypothetical protein
VVSSKYWLVLSDPVAAPRCRDLVLSKCTSTIIYRHDALLFIFTGDTIIEIELFQRTWCTVIANRTYLLQHGGRPAPPPSASYTGMLKSIATSAYRVVMVCTSVVVSFLLGKIPVVGGTAEFIFLCWIDS